MYCAIYKSQLRQDTYLYLADKDDFTCVPDHLVTLLGTPLYVMDLELSPQRKLAQEDVLEVMQNLQMRGWHLQLPRTQTNWLSKH
jgi:uncharacterized protein YcgL (UPF0745 family)